MSTADNVMNSLIFGHCTTSLVPHGCPIALYTLGLKLLMKAKELSQEDSNFLLTKEKKCSVLFTDNLAGLTQVYKV